MHNGNHADVAAVRLDVVKEGKIMTWGGVETAKKLLAAGRGSAYSNC